MTTEIKMMTEKVIPKMKNRVEECIKGFGDEEENQKFEKKNEDLTPLVLSKGKRKLLHHNLTLFNLKYTVLELWG